MALGDRIRKRRIEKKGWTDEDFAERKAARQKIWGGIKMATKFVPVPGVAAAAEVVDTAVEGGREIREGGAPNIRAIANLSADVLDEALTAAVDSPDVPEFTAETAELLKQPVVQLALRAGNEIIDLVEEKTGIDIPEEVEEMILEAVLDIVEDMYDEVEDQIADIGGDVLDKIKGWAAPLLGKLFD